MKINMKETIKLCAVLLQLENVLALNNVSGEEGMLTDGEKLEAEKELNLLLRCANLACHETASEYIHLLAFETFETKDGRIEYTAFKRQPVDIYAVKKDGAACRFKLYPSELITSPGSVEVHYTHLPEKTGLDGDFEFEEGKMSTRILAYGTAAEYCVICGMYEEARIWDKRYKDSIFAALRSRKSVILPARRWG